MSTKLYRTLYDIEALGLTIPKGSFVKLKFQSKENYYGSSWYEFLGLFSGLTKIIPDNEVVFDSYSEK